MIQPRSPRPIPGGELLLCVLLLGLLAPASLPSRAEAQAAAAADTSLAALRAAVAAHPAESARARAYRQSARRAGQLDSAIAHLKSALVQAPGAHGVRFELALALVDRLNAKPALDLPAQSVVASQAIRYLTEILSAEPEQWAARYARGMTHLMFPRPTKHYEPAAEDFVRLTEIQRMLPKEEHFARTFVALGDAYVLDLQLKAARSSWETGKKLFPGDPELLERLGITLSNLEAEIVPRYRFDLPFDTDRDELRVP